MQSAIKNLHPSTIEVLTEKIGKLQIIKKPIKYCTHYVVLILFLEIRKIF